jgi:hypothetical protein
MKKNKPQQPHKKGPGNTTEAPKDYKDPVGSKENGGNPKNSGYEEKQPRGK